jgi:leukotriene-A4 hydrolase
MENPQITFANSYIIVGDKSAVNVIAHEIAHSWTGNLVSISNWTNFYLKESFTRYIESKIIQKFYGIEFATVRTYLGYFYLKKEIDEKGETDKFTTLCPDLQNENPRLVINQIPYEKGFLFLKYLEVIHCFLKSNI